MVRLDETIRLTSNKMFKYPKSPQTTSKFKLFPRCNKDLKMVRKRKIALGKGNIKRLITTNKGRIE